MISLKTILNLRNSSMKNKAAIKDFSSSTRPSKVGAFGRAFAMAAVGMLTIGSAAQTAPAYVVYSSKLLSSTFSATRGHFAANSRGDFFANDGNGHVYEYPANGGAPTLLFTDANNNGGAGIAVDPFDNLFVGDMTYNGPAGTNDQDSLLYEFPSTNQTYPGAYIYNSSKAPGSCNPAVAATASTAAVNANTGVCSVGFYQGAAYYYWQGWWDTAVDGQGNVYTYSGYDNHYGSTSLGVFQCQIYCAQQIAGNGASTYTVTLPNSLLSIAADYAGNLYLADLTNVYIIPAGSPSSGNTPTVFDTGYNQPYGVTLDVSGNLYVTDQSAIWEIPAVEVAGGAPCKGGIDPCKLLTSAKYKLIPLTASSTVNPYGSYSAPGVDNRGNIIFSPSQGNIFEYSLWGASFPSAQTGVTGSTTANFTINFDAATTLASFTAKQGSGPSTEFAVTPGTCIVGTAFAAGSTCTFSASFTPSGLGLRTGAVVITDATGTSTTTYLTGTGTGTALTVDPGTPTSIGSGLTKPEGVALDSAGNVYVADPSAGKVQEFPVGGGAAVSIGTGLIIPTGVAVDAAGNVFIVNQGKSANTGTIVEVPNVAGVLTNSAQRTLVSGLNLPTDIVADGVANLYITSTGDGVTPGSGAVFQLANPSRDKASAAMVPRGYGLTGPTGIALDNSGNIFVADTGNNRVLEISDGSQIAVGSGLSAPTGVTVDPSGSVLIADGTGRLIRVPNETFGMNAAGLNQADQQVLSSPLSYPYSVRIDATGNLYVSDNHAAVVDELQRTTGAINFGNWNLNVLSDSQSIILSNAGNSDVTVGNPIYPPVPAASEFAVTNGTGSSACGSGAFHSGYNCTVQATFDATALGASTYPLIFSATASNTTAPTVNLTGTGVNELAATLNLVRVAPTTTVISYGQQIIINAVVAPSGSTATPTGYLVFNFNGQNQRPILLKNGTASITFNGLNAGSNTLSAYYEGDTTYASLNSAVLPLNIIQATTLNVLTIVGDSASPLSAAPTSSFQLTDTLTPSVVGLFTGTVNFVNLTTGLSVNATPIRLGSPDPKTGLYSVSITLPSNDPSLGTPPAGILTGATLSANIAAVYSGNTNYFGNVSNAVGLIVSIPTYNITPTTNTVTASAATPGVINLTVTDLSNFQGGVALTCTGLPANAYCVFRPGSANLIPAPGVLPNTQLSPLTINAVPVTLTVYVDQNPIPIESASLLWIGAVFLGAAFVWRRKLIGGKLGLLSLVAILCVSGLTALSGCNGSSTNAFPTTPGTYAVTIMGTGTPLNTAGSTPPCLVASLCVPPAVPGAPNVVKTVSLNLTVK